MDSPSKVDPRLHHYCQNVTTGHLQDVVEMYRFFNMEVVYTPPEHSDWLMLGQKQLRFAIQVTEVLDVPVNDIDLKKRIHVAFISNDPNALIEKVETWARERNFKFRKGGWSKIERYFDLPDIFVNFVVEVMHTSIEDI